jgi:hypothetical protein
MPDETPLDFASVEVASVTPSRVAAPAPTPMLPSKLQSDRIYIIIATAAAYFASYVYELGYARHFGYPYSFIGLNLQNLLITGLGFAGILVTGFQVYGLVADMTDLHEPIGVPRWMILFARKYGLSLLILLVILGIMRRVDFYLGCLIFTLTLPIAVDLILSSFKDAKETYWVALARHLESPLVQGAWIGRGLASPASATYLKTFILAAGFLGLASLMGMAEASYCRSFLRPSNEQIILRRYGDHFVIARYEESTRSIQPEFWVVSQSYCRSSNPTLS